jgi:hypothetical protein
MHILASVYDRFIDHLCPQLSKEVTTDCLQIRNAAIGRGNRLIQPLCASPSNCVTTANEYDAANPMTSMCGVASTWDDNWYLLNSSAYTCTYELADRLKTATDNLPSVSHLALETGDDRQAPMALTKKSHYKRKL